MLNVINKQTKHQLLQTTFTQKEKKITSMIRNFFNQKYKFSKKIHIKNIFFFSKTDFVKIKFTIIPKKKKKCKKKRAL